MKGINPKDFNKKMKPTDDFFEFVSGGWIKTNPVPPSENRWGSFYELGDKNIKNLHALIRRMVKTRHRPGSNIQKVSDFFAAAMNTASINREGITGLSHELEKIEGIKTIEDLVKTVAHLHRIGSAPLWYPSVEPDDKKSTRTIFRLYQAGLGLPDRDYYIRTDAKSAEIRIHYLIHIEKIFILNGSKVQEAKAAARKVLEIETRLARASMTAVQRRDVHKTYNKFTLNDLKKKTPHITWDVYLAGIGIGNFHELIVSQPNFIKEVDLMLRSLDIKDWKIYLTWHVVSSFSSHLGSRFEKETFNFYGRVLNGMKKIKPRWKRAVSMVDGALGEPLGRLYVEQYFSKRAKKKMNELVNNVTAAYRERIKNLEWMSILTKKKALIKLNAIVRKIGYPDKWRNYAKLAITRQSHLQNVINAEIFEFKRTMAKLGKAVDRTEWFMSPPTVNAYYSVNINEIVFPAGILQPPYFSEHFDDALNYGAIGAVIGHELTHGFDDQGSHFDEKGSMRNWWTKQDRKKFEKKSDVIIKQFNAYTAVDNLHVNGKLTLGENIADLGGLAIAYDALKMALKNKKIKLIDGFTPEQRFFIGFAIGERGVYRLEALRQRVLADPHSPPKFRVNGSVSNLMEFYEAFGVKKGDALYRSEGKRAKIW